MAVYCMDLNETWVHIFSGDKEKDNPTKWTLGNLDSSLYLSLEDVEREVIRDTGRVSVSYNYGHIYSECFRFGCQGVENLKDSKGNTIEFKRVKQFIYGKDRMVVDPDLMSKIPPSIISELGSAIYSKQRLSEGERKS